MTDTKMPDNRDELTEIREEIFERIKQEDAIYPRKNEDPKKNAIKPGFIKRCLDANELGDGLLFREVNRMRYLYNNLAGMWMAWKGHHWDYDLMNGALSGVEYVVETLLKETDRLNEQIKFIVQKDKKGKADEYVKNLERLRERILKRVWSLRTDKRRSTTLKFSRTCEHPLAIRGDEMDRDPWLLACRNGVIDLRAGEFRDGRPSDLISKASPCKWQGLNAVPELWEKTLLEIFNGDKEVVAYLQRLFGYAITGLNIEHIFPIFWGKGRNGKDLLVNVISAVLGPLAAPIPAELLLDQWRPKSASGPSPEIMQLKGLRIAFASETDEGRRFSASKVKWLSGGGELVGRNPHDKWQITFKPTHTLFLLTNSKPHADGGDFALWERLHLVPFKISFVNRPPEEENERWADKDLYEKLGEEFNSILSWVVRGCLLYQKHGLNPPEAIKKATLEYKKDEDLLGQFIEECCNTGPGEEDSSTDIYERFNSWWEENVSKTVPKHKSFGTMMSKRFEKTKSHGLIVYKGIALKKEF